MVLLGSPPLASRRNLSHDAALPPLLVGLLCHFARNLLLLGVVEVDSGAVLGAGIGALLVECRGVMRLVEEFEELRVCDLCRVENDLRGFSVCCDVSHQFFNTLTGNTRTYVQSCRRRRRDS